MKAIAAVALATLVGVAASANAQAISAGKMDITGIRLGMTEAELQRVLAQRAGDSGVASVYKNVQGLSPTAVQAELKKALMSKIFEANVELRRQIGAQPENPS